MILDKHQRFHQNTHQQCQCHNEHQENQNWQYISLPETQQEYVMVGPERRGRKKKDDALIIEKRNMVNWLLKKERWCIDYWKKVDGALIIDCWITSRRSLFMIILHMNGTDSCCTSIFCHQSHRIIIFAMKINFSIFWPKEKSYHNAWMDNLSAILRDNFQRISVKKDSLPALFNIKKSYLMSNGQMSNSARLIIFGCWPN